MFQIFFAKWMLVEYLENGLRVTTVNSFVKRSCTFAKGIVEAQQWTVRGQKRLQHCTWVEPSTIDCHAHRFVDSLIVGPIRPGGGSTPDCYWVTQLSLCAVLPTHAYTIYLCIVNQNCATFHNLPISIRRSTCFRRFFRPTSGAQNCTYSVRYLSDQYCC